VTANMNQVELGSRLDFATIDATYRSYMDDYLTLKGFDPSRFLIPLPSADEMYFKALLPNYEGDHGIAAFKFVESTMRLHDAYRQIVDQVFGGYDQLNTVLDFASGYGRLTRALVQKLPAERIHVADIYDQAIAWQVEMFGVNGVVSVPDPAQLDHHGRHDIVFVGSLFSHLPAGLFHRWLARLYDLVAPGGVLAFSVHDETFLPKDETMDGSGLRYFRTSESGSLDHDIYGMSYVTEAFVGEAISRLAPGDGPSWRRFHKGLYENQDLYVVGGPGRNVSSLDVASSPMGGFEAMTLLTNGDLHCAGWVQERSFGRRIEAVRVHIDGHPWGEAQMGGERPDVAAHFPHAANPARDWSLRLPRSAGAPGAVIRLDFESDTGLVTHAYGVFPTNPAITYSGWSRRSLQA
jgi:SAM-dependent methyltransferase